MHTQNVKTAAPESSERWGETFKGLGRESWNAATEAAYWEIRAKSFVTAPVEIDLHRYMDVLGTLPPLDWQGDRDSESFKFAEMYCGSVTDIYAKFEGRYFHLRDEYRLNHSEIIKRIKEAIGQKDNIQK
ncbi:hypothetical protein AB6866_23345 [Rahnella inusitata]|uniref:hypothetical protein n=1 Tax=Rahnella TaxID=34037 RepID=UPI0039B04B62